MEETTRGVGYPPRVALICLAMPWPRTVLLPVQQLKELVPLCSVGAVVETLESDVIHQLVELFGILRERTTRAHKCPLKDLGFVQGKPRNYRSRVVCCLGNFGAV